MPDAELRRLAQSEALRVHRFCVDPRRLRENDEPRRFLGSAPKDLVCYKNEHVVPSTYEAKCASPTGPPGPSGSRPAGEAAWLEPVSGGAGGVQLLAACYGVPAGKRVIGIGRFASGMPDLGSYKKHLREFGIVICRPILPTPA